MKIQNFLRSGALIMLAAFCVTVSQAQRHDSRGPISHHSDSKNDDEYRMSHIDADAGDLIGIVLPKRLMDMQIKSGRWDVAESGMIRIADHTSTSANLRLLKSGTTVVNYKYRYMKDGKEESASYPFTIRIHRVEPEVITLPSTLYVGWDVAENLMNHVTMKPEYSECPVSFTVEDPTMADLREGYYGPTLTGRSLGETVIYLEASNGLRAEARVLIQVPALRDIDIKADEKRFAVGDQMQLEVKISPERAQPELVWSSDKPEVVTVDQTGMVTAVSEGKATIRVTSDNGKKDSITLKVKN